MQWQVCISNPPVSCSVSIPGQWHGDTHLYMRVVVGVEGSMLILVCFSAKSVVDERSEDCAIEY